MRIIEATNIRLNPLGDGRPAVVADCLRRNERGVRRDAFLFETEAGAREFACRLANLREAES